MEYQLMTQNAYAASSPAEKPHWRDMAACLGSPVNLFDAEPNTPKADRAKAICESCKVRLQCLEWALTLDERDDHLILGGLTEKERRKIRKEAAA
jgi:WhiB family redox-sensing transcriptional regulator